MRRRFWSIKTGLVSVVVIQFVIILTFLGQYRKHENHSNCVLSPGSFRDFSKDTSAMKARKYSANHAISERDVSPFESWTFSIEDLPWGSSVPRIVHQVLTSNTVTFRNYLSILSVYKFLRPYRIILYIHGKFKPQQYEYNQWFQKAVAEIPCLEIVHSEKVDRLGIKFDTVNELRFVSSVLKQGGVYVNLNTIINLDPWVNAHDKLQIGFAANSLLGFVTADKHSNFTDLLLVRNFSNAGVMKKVNTSKCVFLHLFTGTEHCCIIQEEIFPIDIMRQNSPFAAFARYLFYGTQDILQPQKLFVPIPKIVHYLWFGNKSITYAMYLSFWSTMRFVKPVKVLIYVDSYDLGYYFDEMKRSSFVSVVFYGTPNTVFQRPIKSHSHMSDYVRTDVLLRFGGIYMDWDVYWLKPVDDLLSLGYETIAAFDHYRGLGRQEFPDTINTGVVLARPESRFISLWQDTFHKYTGDHVTFHAVEVVYKLYELHPDLLYIEKRLQVICFRFKCHPLWLTNYQEDHIHNEFDFTREAYAVHFTDPIPKSFISEEELKSSTGFFGDMARHVYGDFK